MARLVIVGGFITGRHSIEKVAKASEAYFEDPVPYTLSDYVNNPDEVQKAIRGADVLLHSAGALAIDDPHTRPKYAYMFNPPLPRSIGGLVVRAGVKTARMFTPGLGIHRPSDVGSVIGFSAGSIAEAAAHPIANFKMLRRISEFDAVSSAVVTRQNGIDVGIIWTDNDAFYKPSVDDIASANASRIPQLMLEGEHDELLIRPDAILRSVFGTESSI